MVKALTTFPKQDKDKLIFFAYSNVCPLTPLFLIFSLPARSMKHNLLRNTLSPQTCVRCRKRIVCDLEEQSLLWVVAILRSLYPNRMSSITSCKLYTRTSTNPSNATLSAAYFIRTPSPCFNGSNKSINF